MTEPIDYKQLAEELYLSLKMCESPLTLRQERVMKKYEDLHKPKMTWYPNGGEYIMDVVNFENSSKFSQYVSLVWFFNHCAVLYEILLETVLFQGIA